MSPHSLLSSRRRAVIDIGTNSVKLLVADVNGREVIPILEKSEQTRLGEGFYSTHVLQPVAIERTARAVAAYRRDATALAPEAIRIIATSAARDAVNQSALLQAVEAASGLKVEVISGEQEAQWACVGVQTDAALAGLPLLIADVGGGSTEFILCDADAHYFRESFRLGTVRLLEQLRWSDPPTASEHTDCAAILKRQFDREVRPVLEPAMKSFAPRTPQLVGTGGTTTILARIQLQARSFDRAQLEAVRLTRADVRDLQARLWSCALAERRKIVGLPPNRADVILAGVAIFAVLMEEFGFHELRVSTRGLRFAAVMED